MNSENIAEKYTKYYHSKTTDTSISWSDTCWEHRMQRIDTF